MALKLYVSEASPYSIKIWALLNYVGLAPQVVHQNIINRFATIKRRSGATMVPMLLESGRPINDSTRIIEHVQSRAERPLIPDFEGAGFLAWLLEDFADEWMVRWFVTDRWAPDVAEVCGKRVGRELFFGIPVASEALGVQVGRVLSKTLAKKGVLSDQEALKTSRSRLLSTLETLFEDQPYIFGNTPSVADFSFYGVLWQHRSDPLGAKALEGYPRVNEFIDRVDAWRWHKGVWLEPKLRDLSELEDLFAEVFGTYMLMLVENLKSRSSSSRSAKATLLDGSPFEFKASGYFIARLKEHLARGIQPRRDLLPDAAAKIEEGWFGVLRQLSDFEAGRQVLKEFGFE